MYIVAWSVGTKQDAETNTLIYRWEVFDTMEDAFEKYSNLLNSKLTYTTSVCEVMESTNYGN